MLSHPAIRACGGLLLLGLMALSVGCTSSKGRAIVKGQVTFDGTPLPSGSVTFSGANNATGTATIEDGKYVMNDAPLGEVKITVTAPPPLPMGPRPGTVDKGSVDPEHPERRIPIMSPLTKRLPIPEKYASPATSGLTFKVERGEQTHDINLTK